MSRALVVDDTELGQYALAEELRGSGFQVRVVADGYAALAAFPDIEPSVLVVDFQLPGIDGIDLIERVRSFSDVPAILITAYGSPSLTQRAHQVGAQVVLDFNRDIGAVSACATELVTARAASSHSTRRAGADQLRRRGDVLLKAHLEKALLDANGNVSEAARRLGISRGSFRYQIDRLGI